jgi:MFS family permease
MKHTFRSLAHRNFRLLFTGMAVSMVGTWLQFIAQALLVLRLTDSGVALGIVTAAQFGPILLFGAWAGVLCDRVDKRRLMFATQAAMMVLAVALGVLVLSGRATIGVVYVFAGLTGVAIAFDNPVRRTILTELVDDDDLHNAVSLNSAVITASKIVGPALAAVLVSTVGIGWCFVLNGLSFVAVLWALRAMDGREIRSSERLPKAKGQIRAGLAYVWSQPDLRVPLLMMSVIATLAFNWHVLIPLLATRDLGGDSTTYAVLTTAMSIGSMAGALLLARRRVVDTHFLARGCVLFGLASLALSLAPNLAVACVTGVIVGASGIALLSGTMTLLQLGAVPVMRGRVMALFSIVFLGSTPVGGPLSGWVAEHLGSRVAIGMGAVAALTTGVVALAVARRQVVVADGMPDLTEQALEAA